MAHVAPYKKEAVADLVKRLADSKVVGIANIQGIPAPQFQAIRRKLHGRATITVSKNSLLMLALKEAAARKPHLDQLVDAIDGQTAVLTAEMNPFRLFKELEATKTRAPARGGELAPDDLERQVFVSLQREHPHEPPVVLGVGRLVKQKDFPTLLRAFAKVRSMRPSSRSAKARLFCLG